MVQKEPINQKLYFVAFVLYGGVSMYYSIIVPCGTENLYYTLLPRGNFQKIVVEGVVVFDVFKRHNHSYELSCFFYVSKRIVSCRIYRTKKELHCAIQKLIQEELNIDVQ